MSRECIIKDCGNPAADSINCIADDSITYKLQLCEEHILDNLITLDAVVAPIALTNEVNELRLRVASLEEKLRITMSQTLVPFSHTHRPHLRRR